MSPGFVNFSLLCAFRFTSSVTKVDKNQVVSMELQKDLEPLLNSNQLNHKANILDNSPTLEVNFPNLTLEGQHLKAHPNSNMDNLNRALVGQPLRLHHNSLDNPNRALEDNLLQLRLNSMVSLNLTLEELHLNRTTVSPNLMWEVSHNNLSLSMDCLNNNLVNHNHNTELLSRSKVLWQWSHLS